MMNRRNFLGASLGLGTFSALALNACNSSNSSSNAESSADSTAASSTATEATTKNVGLQLYTLRDDIQKQGIETILAQVGKLGYKKVENFGYTDGKFFGKTPAEYSSLLKDNGLLAVSGHTLTARSKQAGGADGLTKNWQRVVDDAAAIGQEYIIIAYLFDDERKPDDYKQLVELLSKGQETARKAGLTLGYHNHDFEFNERVDGQMPYELILKNTTVQMEMDLYWIARTGQKPADYFAKYPGRFPLWHVKDMANTPEKEFAEVGTGSIDFAAIFDKAGEAGMKHYFVEQDICKRPPLESIKISIDNIQKANWG
ncbi:sugar phosphate isomerase/epimerase [Larkinella arboricola]|uniref:Sugar phosphate isomerase/epimerase n=1 Tax=Larkinella arboricola TaxID=643671 RepID=A0A327WWT2_LARAB|nr:sugar phosphate isomerase/epimerase [Larkinella arboricola]RAJ97619.1 sugar phosphate isomerase/epimerase [Larkinella arboricola]